MDFFSWKPCKFELPFHSVACSIGVSVKVVFSIEGVGCEVTRLQCRSLVTGGGAKVQVTGHRSGHRPGYRSQATGQVTGHRPQARSQVRPQATGQVTGQITGHTQKQ